jgi:hypothetical protein
MWSMSRLKMMPEEDGPLGASSRRGKHMPTADTICGCWDGGSHLEHSGRVKLGNRGTGGQGAAARENKNHKDRWRAAIGRTNVWVGEDLLLTEEDATAGGGQQVGRSGKGRQGAEPWENENNEARWRATLGGSNVGVGEELLFSEGVEVAAGCA